MSYGPTLIAFVCLLDQISIRETQAPLPSLLSPCPGYPIYIKCPTYSLFSKSGSFRLSRILIPQSQNTKELAEAKDRGSPARINNKKLKMSDRAQLVGLFLKNASPNQGVQVNSNITQLLR